MVHFFLGASLKLPSCFRLSKRFEGTQRHPCHTRGAPAFLTPMTEATVEREAVQGIVERIVQSTPVMDIHTHLYDPAFGELLLWGIDELLIYHYLIAESFRQFDLSYDQFWALTRQQQADAIWQALFIDHSPISEACRGVLTVLNSLG